MARELLHDGWPVDEPKLRRLVGDAQVEAWLAEGVLRYGEPEPVRVLDAPAEAGQGSSSLPPGPGGANANGGGR
jgi:hypothetical protein